MNYEGKVYRPWPEYRSILIQTTLGCSINTCTFCSMFDDKRFKVRPIEDVIKDIEEARLIYPQVESIFLIDGNVMAARTDYLLKIFDKLRSTFPECKKISLYSGLNDFRRKTIAELKELKDSGLDMAYSGLESGDRVVLEGLADDHDAVAPPEAGQCARIDPEAGTVHGAGSGAGGGNPGEDYDSDAQGGGSAQGVEGENSKGR